MPEWIAKYWVEWVFGIIAAALGWMVKRLSARIRKEQEENKALRDGMKALLMRQIQDECEAAVNQGYCPVEVKKTIDQMYQAYHSLGGNGIITGLRDDTMRLPTVESERGDHHDRLGS
jgi:hypothetical protein